MSQPFASPTALPAGISLRHIRVPDDFLAMNAIANGARAVGGEDWATSDEQFVAFYSHLANCDIATDVVIAERDGRVIGYGRVSWRDEVEGSRHYELVTFIEPAESREVEVALHDAVEARAREMAADEGEQRRRAFVIPTAGRRAPMLQERGYLPARYFYQMIRPNLDDLPDAPLPAGVEVRPVRPDELRTIFDAEVEAFQDHWGATLPTEEDFLHFSTDPVEARTELWRVAWDGDQVAGMVRGYVNADENRRFGRKRGYVEHISVRRPWRRRGLARALIAQTIIALREAEMTEGVLDVDSENPTGALGLYEACGFKVASETAFYTKPFEV